MDSLEHQVLGVIRALRDRVRYVQGSLVARADGLLLAHDSHGVEPDGMAALAAATLGLSERLAAEAGHGQFQESVTRGSLGYVATYSAGPYAVLTVLSRAESNLGLLHLEARRTAVQVGRLVEAAETGAPRR